MQHTLTITITYIRGNSKTNSDVLTLKLFNLGNQTKNFIVTEKHGTLSYTENIDWNPEMVTKKFTEVSYRVGEFARLHALEMHLTITIDGVRQIHNAFDYKYINDIQIICGYSEPITPEIIKIYQKYCIGITDSTWVTQEFGGKRIIGYIESAEKIDYAKMEIIKELFGAIEPSKTMVITIIHKGISQIITNKPNEEFPITINF